MRHMPFESSRGAVKSISSVIGSSSKQLLGEMLNRSTVTSSGMRPPLRGAPPPLARRLGKQNIPRRAEGSMSRSGLVALLAVLGTAAGKAAVKQKRQNEDWKGQMLFRERLIAGAGARGVAQTFLHPIDVIRTRLQAKGVSMTMNAETFLKGVAPQFLLAFPAGATQFAAFEFSKERFAAAGLKGSFAELSCGAIGALAASIVRVPQEVIKQRVQADIYPNALAGTIKLMSTEGISGFYKGYFATISRDVPWNALSFMFFAQAKKLYTHLTGNAPDGQQNLMLGAVSGMAAAVIMTPIDVVKTRLMTGGASGGIVGVMKSIIADEGAATLMKGVLPRIAFLAPLAALTLSLYEIFGKMLVSGRLHIPVSEL